MERFQKHKKHKKHKSQKKQTSTKMFIIRTKNTKSANHKKSGFSLKCLLYAQKAQIAKKANFIIRTKAIKSIDRKQIFLDVLHIKNAVLFVILLTLNKSKFY